MKNYIATTTGKIILIVIVISMIGLFLYSPSQSESVNTYSEQNPSYTIYPTKKPSQSESVNTYSEPSLAEICKKNAERCAEIAVEKNDPEICFLATEPVYWGGEDVSPAKGDWYCLNHYVWLKPDIEICNKYLPGDTVCEYRANREK